MRGGLFDKSRIDVICQYAITCRCVKLMGQQCGEGCLPDALGGAQGGHDVFVVDVVGR